MCKIRSLSIFIEDNQGGADVTQIQKLVLYGSIGAHHAILAARSPVFENRFAHDLKEKESSTINIDDISIDACKAVLSYIYIYGCLTPNEFYTHRLALLRAADKYDIGDLKDACEENLLSDINCKNVLDRLQGASLYRLPKSFRSLDV